MLSTTAASQNGRTDSIQKTPESRRWIFSFWSDFFLLHGGCGLVILPVMAIAFCFSQYWLPLFFAYTFLLGLPHVSATHLRLNADPDCKDKFRWLALAAPIAIGGLVFVATAMLKLSSAIVLVWFLAQTWHANAQNFGIMRRYMRMGGSEPRQAVNICAEYSIHLIPWAAVLTALITPSTTFLGYPIAALPSPWLQFCAPLLWWLATGTFVAYLSLEMLELKAGRFVPGRLLAVVSGSIVNAASWLVIKEISWAYLSVSTWHSLQYIAYTYAFRRTPPPGANPLRLSLPKLALFLVLIGAAIQLVSLGLRQLVPSLAIVVHLSLNFHHYLADTMIWRKSKRA